MKRIFLFSIAMLFALCSMPTAQPSHFDARIPFDIVTQLKSRIVTGDSANIAGGKFVIDSKGKATCDGGLKTGLGDTIIVIDATGADSTLLREDGTNTILKADNSTILLITGTDTVKIVNGAVKPKVLTFNIFLDYAGEYLAGTSQNTISGARYASMGGMSFDSLYVDSIFLLGRSVEDTNVVDSVYIASTYSRTQNTIVLVASGTDWGGAGAGFYPYTYSCNATIPVNNKLVVQMKPNKESAQSKTRIYEIFLYGRPK